MNQVRIEKIFSTILNRQPSDKEILRYKDSSYEQIISDLSTCQEKYKQIFSLSGEKIRSDFSEYNQKQIDKYFSSSEYKVAICLSGHLRDYKTNLESIEKFIVKPLNADVFLHTWDSIGKQILFTNNKIGPTPDENSKTIPDIDQYISNVRQIKIESNEEYLNYIKNDNQKKYYLYGMKIRDSVYGGQAEPIYINSQLYSISQSYKLLKEWSKLNGKTYDCIIKMRSDYEVKSGIDLQNLQDIKDNKEDKFIYVPQIPYSNHGHPVCCACIDGIEHSSHIEDVCDVFAYGSESVMEKYFHLFDEKENIRVKQNLKNDVLIAKNGNKYILEKKDDFVLCNIWNKLNYDIDCYYPERMLREHLREYHLKPSTLHGKVNR